MTQPSDISIFIRHLPKTFADLLPLLKEQNDIVLTSDNRALIEYEESLKGLIHLSLSYPGGNLEDIFDWFFDFCAQTAKQIELLNDVCDSILYAEEGHDKELFALIDIADSIRDRGGMADDLAVAGEQFDVLCTIYNLIPTFNQELKNINNNYKTKE